MLYRDCGLPPKDPSKVLLHRLRTHGFLIPITEALIQNRREDENCILKVQITKMSLEVKYLACVNSLKTVGTFKMEKN